MGLPKAVQEANAEADRLFKEQTVEEVKDVVLEIDPKLLEKDEVDDVPIIDPNNLDNVQNLDSIKSEPAKIIKEAPKKDENTERMSTLERLNKSLDNENHSLKIKRLENERTITELREENAALISRGNEKPAAEEPVSHKFSADERAIFAGEGFSDEIIDIFEKRGVQPVAPQADNSRVDMLEKEIASVKIDTHQGKEKTFWDDLDAAVPNWEEINKEAGWLEFIRTVPRYANQTLQQMIDDARENLDAKKITQIFNDYSKLNEGTDNTVDPNKEVKKDKPNLTDLAAPKSSNAPTPTAKPAKWTTDESTKFYNYVARNPGKYTDKQIAAIEKTHIFPG